jgi:hypothetical protein
MNLNKYLYLLQKTILQLSPYHYLSFLLRCPKLILHVYNGCKAYLFDIVEQPILSKKLLK